jgi:hypothetical protein
MLLWSKLFDNGFVANNMQGDLGGAGIITFKSSTTP